MDYRRVFRKYYNLAEIPKGFDIHHIDGNRENNEISNLTLLPRDIHVRHHKISRFSTKRLTNFRANFESATHEIKQLLKEERFIWADELAKKHGLPTQEIKLIIRQLLNGCDS
jgi:hypothetical protein